MKTGRLRTLLLGMGNPILSDDAVGVRLAGDFKARLEAEGGRPDLEIVEECSVGGLNLLDIVSGYDRLIVFDCIKTQGGEPGKWYYFTAESLRETMNLSSIHDTNFATALALGRKLGHKIPAENEVHIFAENLTPPLENAYPFFSDAIFAAVLRLLS
jgi:hydrogenase maturation protease